MRKLLIILALVLFVIQPVSATTYTAPDAPESAQKYMPPDTQTFGDGLWYVVKSAIATLQPNVAEAEKTCLSVIAVVMLLSIVRNFTGISKRLVGLVGALSMGILLFRSSNSMIQLGTQTVQQMTDYGKLLIPTLTAASAANGTPVTSAALYTGTVIFSSVLSTVITKLVVPLIYVFMALCVADSASGENILQSMKDLVKWMATWTIKTVLYVFTGYMSITGVISGSVDAAAVKAAKITISGAVPVVGSIISDASESILLSAGIMKNSAGIYGAVAIIATCIGPFFKIGIHYLLLKLTAAVCGVFGEKGSDSLLKSMTSAMGLVMAMTGTVCLLLLISVVCFLRSIG